MIERRLAILLTVGVLFCTQHALAQKTLVTAEDYATRAVELMDANLAETALEHWAKAIALAPGYTPYVYERAVCLVMVQRYNDAIESLLPIYQDTALRDRAYQLLGNCYDYLQDTTSSLRYYQEGIKANPNSGRLHFEMGQRAFIDRNRDLAHSWWIKGTRAEPRFATNYYWLAKSFGDTKEKLWSALYAEAFLNLERNSTRTREMSKLVFEVWNSALKLGDTLDPVNFVSEDVLEQPDRRGYNVLAFPVAFEYTIATVAEPFAPKDEKPAQLSIEQLVELRYRFMKAWSSSGYDTTHPNSVLDWNKHLQMSGKLKEYLWWLYAYGDKLEMNAYFRREEQRYDTFLGWFGQRSMDFQSALCLGIGCP